MILNFEVVLDYQSFFNTLILANNLTSTLKKPAVIHKKLT